MQTQFSTETLELVFSSLAFLFLKRIKPFLSIGVILIAWFGLLLVERILLLNDNYSIANMASWTFVVGDLLAIGYFYYYGMIRTGYINFRYNSKSPAKWAAWSVLIVLITSTMMDCLAPEWFLMRNGHISYNCFMLAFDGLVGVLIGLNEYAKRKKQREKQARAQS